MSSGSCPYVGLQAFTEDQADYFFGRERDERIVIANLAASPLSVLYGATGAGKSSLLRAGVVPRLRRRERTTVVRVDAWHGRDVLATVKAACVTAAGAATADTVDLDASLPLDELLAHIAAAVGGPTYLLLDQFEEYFVSHPVADADDAFEAELARVVNTDEVDAAVLVALREDALAQLDRFRLRIPGLLANTIRIRHLTPAAAEDAIRKPLQVYEEQTGVAVRIESELVDELLEQVRVRAGRSVFAAGAAGAGGEAAADEIETPFLQLVLERLWHAEVDGGPTTLRLQTFRRLGGASGIVARHFDAVVDALSPDQRELCSRFFDRLVTGSGGKIAYPVDDLARVAGRLEPHVEETLETLTRARILRRVELPERAAVEIFHDVLAPTILRWQEQFVRLRERALERRKLRRRLLEAALVVAAILVFFAYRSYMQWRHDRPWAVMTDLATGTPYGLTSAQATIGRNDGYYENQLNANLQRVSRIHLLIVRRGWRAVDMRSLQGTTINATFLEYSHSRFLRRGDIVALAGVVAFTFAPVHYSWYQFWTPSLNARRPARTAALLIDGRSRSSTPLTGAQVSLGVRGTRIVVVDGGSRDALVAVRIADGNVQIEDLRDATPLVAQWKTADSESYPRMTVPSGTYYSTLIGADHEPAVFSLGRAQFQIVPLQ